MERVGEGQGKMERYCSIGQSPQWVVAPTEEEEEANILVFLWHMHTSLQLFSFCNNTTTDITTTTITSSSCNSNSSINSNIPALSYMCFDECNSLVSYFFSSFLSNGTFLLWVIPKASFPQNLTLMPFTHLSYALSFLPG